MKKLYRTIFCLFISLFMAGCNTTPNLLISNFDMASLFDWREVNLRENSYAIADLMDQQLNNRLSDKAVLKVGDLSRLYDKPEKVQDKHDSNAFGRVVPDHIAARYAQLGYLVDKAEPAELMMVRALNGTKEETLTGPEKSTIMKAEATPVADEALMTGHYSVSGRDVYVHLRVIDIKTGDLLAAHDYSLPLTGEVRALIPRPRLESDNVKKAEEKPAPDKMMDSVADPAESDAESLNQPG